VIKIKRIYIYITIPLLIILICALFFMFLHKKKPVTWTCENSLHLVRAPDIDDRSEIDTLIRSIDFSLKYLNKIDPKTLMSFGKEKFTSKNIKTSLIDFKEKLKELGLTKKFFTYIRKNYTFYKSSAKKVLYTGYYEANLKGSLTQSDIYKYPLYRKPEDLYRIDLSKFPFYHKYNGLPEILRGRLSKDNLILPYYTRKEIDSEKKLAEKNLEIVWVDNVIELFFLQIQGSGIIHLDTGETLRVNYAESNGHAYQAIGRLLIDKGLLSKENVSMQSIRNYIEKHPEQMEQIFNYNPSYIFFRKVDEGPIGSIGVPLTPFRSIATDRHLFPKGAICYIKTRLPLFDENNKVKEWKLFQSFVLNQDSGGVIRTPGRVDLFTGNGKKSELIAGHINQNGNLYFLIKKPLE